MLSGSVEAQSQHDYFYLRIDCTLLPLVDLTELSLGGGRFGYMVP